MAGTFEDSIQELKEVDILREDRLLYRPTHGYLGSVVLVNHSYSCMVDQFRFSFRLMQSAPLRGVFVCLFIYLFYQNMPFGVQ